MTGALASVNGVSKTKSFIRIPNTEYCILYHGKLIWFTELSRLVLTERPCSYSGGQPCSSTAGLRLGPGLPSPGRVRCQQGQVHP